MRIFVLALDELFDTGLVVTLDAFKLANKFAAMLTGGGPRFDVSVVGVRKRVTSGQGFVIPVKAITPASKPDWVIVPALSAGSPDQIVPALKRKDVIDAKAQRVLLMLGYPDVYEAADHVVDINQFQPTALEGMDHRLYEYMAKNGGRNRVQFAKSAN